MRVDSGPVSRLVTLLVVLGLLAAGCGDPASEPAGTSEHPVTTATTASTTPAETTTAAPASTAGAPTTTAATAPTTTTVPPVPTTIAAPPVLREDTPPLVDIDGWLASAVTSLEELRGSVVVVEFWTFGCYNCKNRIPYTQDLYAMYKDQGLEIVGIHSPEFGYEREVANIEQAMVDLGVTWPVVLDTDRRTFREWQGRPAYWPRTYVVDKQGRIRFDHIGEGAYEELFQVVGYLLSESA
ncbi:MAG: redoxin domain-containing protein [bacterium]|nr:redoxin domain-containing protein [bacterium]MDE0287784.1 redoxin domain-containing protein [bacterium]MDE0439059.1 redoxin domain-containing protein [bacterium]